MFKSRHFQTALRTSLIAFFGVVLGWAIFSEQSVIWISLISVFLLGQIIYFIRYQSRIIEQIDYFFESIENEDFSQSFKQRDKSAILQNLQKNMQKINLYVQQIRIEAQQQQQYFRALTEHLNTGILTYDERGFVIHANQAVKNLFGLEQLTHLKQLERVDSHLLDILPQIEQQEQLLVTFNGQQGKVNLSIKASTFKSREQNLILLSIQDINKELDEKELDSWMRLIRVLTHEIMNSIAPLTSLSESLNNYFQKEGKAITPDAVNEKIIDTTIRGLTIIKEQGKGLIDFVESYRTLTRLPKPDKKMIEVESLIQNMGLLNKAENQNTGIKLTVHLESSGLSILADEKMINQVLFNLIKNAREALSESENGEIELWAGKNKNGKVAIKIRDNGPGIPPELLDEIFVPFFTTREKGSGIGLSLSRQIMRLHGGNLRVRSTPNKETTFTLLFG